MTRKKIDVRLAVDVGGTFTDLFGWHQKTNESISAKVLTTRPDRSLSVIQAIKQAGLDFAQILHLLHGTTTATNALIERNYPAAALPRPKAFATPSRSGGNTVNICTTPIKPSRHLSSRGATALSLRNGCPPAARFAPARRDRRRQDRRSSSEQTWWGADR